MTTVRRPIWKIETRTGDRPPHPEWLELRSAAKRFYYVERDEAEKVLATLQQTQPQAEFRIAPI